MLNVERSAQLQTAPDASLRVDLKMPGTLRPRLVLLNTLMKDHPGDEQQLEQAHCLWHGRALASGTRGSTS